MQKKLMENDLNMTVPKMLESLNTIQALKVDLVNQPCVMRTEITGDNTDLSINFIPKMDYETLIKGYKKILSKIYAPEHYYERVISFLKEYKFLQKRTVHFQFSHLGAFFKSILFLGIKDKERIYYWKLFFWSLFRRPRLFSLAITYAIYGFHFRRIFVDCM